MAKANTMEDVWIRVAKGQPGECWPWTGYLVDGYGRVRLQGTWRTVHKILWEQAYGPVPIGLQLDHLCRNRACTNPSHMEVVSSRTNSLRGIGPTANNARKTHCKNGHEFTPDNTYVQIRPQGISRNCRICARANNRRNKYKRVVASLLT